MKLKLLNIFLPDYSNYLIFITSIAIIYIFVIFIRELCKEQITKKNIIKNILYLILALLPSIIAIAM